MSKKLSSKSPPWPDLPPEILLKIGKLTGFSVYQLQFKAVCKPWRSSFATVDNWVTNNYPLKVPYHPLSGFYGKDLVTDAASLFIVPTTSYVIQPTNGSFVGSSVVVTVDEINRGYLSPRYPLSRSHCGVFGLGGKGKRLDLLETRVMFVNYGFSLRVLHVRRNASKKDGRENELSFVWRGSSEKAVVLSNPCCGNDLWVVVLCYGEGLMGLRVRDGVWKAVCDGKVSKCVDVVKFKEVIYGIDRQGRAFLIDYDFENGDANIIKVAPCVVDGGEKGKRLVIDSSYNGGLYMVVLRPLRTQNFSFAFSVYRLNEEVGMWEKVKSIENRMFFVGVNFSFCATSGDFPGLAMSCMRSVPRNCIFFGKGSFPGRSYEEVGDELLFGKGNEGTGMNIGQYFLGDRRATGILEPAFVIMFSYLI